MGVFKRGQDARNAWINFSNRLFEKQWIIEVAPRPRPHISVAII